jgi:hypothetical protein
MALILRSVQVLFDIMAAGTPGADASVKRRIAIYLK